MLATFDCRKCQKAGTYCPGGTLLGIFLGGYYTIYTYLEIILVNKRLIITLVIKSPLYLLSYPLIPFL